MSRSNELLFVPKKLQKVVPHSASVVPYSQAQDERELIRDTTQILTRYGIPAKLFTVYPEAEEGVPFFVSSGHRSGWWCQGFDPSQHDVPLFAQQALVAAVQIGVPIVDVRVARAVSVLPRDLDSVIRQNTELAALQIGRLVQSCLEEIERRRIERERKRAEFERQRAAKRQRQLAERRTAEAAERQRRLLYDPDPALLIRLGSEGYFIELARWE